MFDFDDPPRHSIYNYVHNNMIVRWNRHLSGAGRRLLKTPSLFGSVSSPVPTTSTTTTTSTIAFGGSDYCKPTVGFFSSTSSSSFETHPSMVKQRFHQRLQDEREKALMGGGKARIDRQHSRGRLTARERLELLFDNGSFREMDQLKAHRCNEFGMETKYFPGDGIVTGHGLVNGRHVYAFSQGTYENRLCTRSEQHTAPWAFFLSLPSPLTFTTNIIHVYIHHDLWLRSHI